MRVEYFTIVLIKFCPCYVTGDDPSLLTSTEDLVSSLISPPPYIAGSPRILSNDY